MNRLNINYFTNDFPYVEYVKSIILRFDNIDLLLERQLIEKVQNIYRDAKKLELDEKEIKTLIHITVSTLISKFIPNLVTAPNKKEIMTLLNKLCFNKELRKKIQLQTWESDFFSILKNTAPIIEDLEQAIRDNQSFKVLLIYSNLIEILNRDGLNPAMSNASLKKELEKIYPFTSDINRYKCYINFPRIYGHKSDELTCFVRTETYGMFSSLLIKYFYIKMIEYYNETGYFYRKIDDNFSLYILNQKIFLTYKYDDSIDLQISYLRNNYGMKTYEFWALTADMSEYRLSLDVFSTINTRKLIEYIDVIVCPEENIEASFIRYVIEELGEDLTDVHTLLTELGVDYSIKYQDLIRLKNGIFIKNINEYSRLNIKSPKEYPTLEKLLQKDDTEKKQYIKRLKNRIKSVSTPQKSFENYGEYHYRKKSKGRKDYID